MVQAFQRRKLDVIRALVRQKIRTGRLPMRSVPILLGALVREVPVARADAFSR